MAPEPEHVRPRPQAQLFELWLCAEIPANRNHGLRMSVVDQVMDVLVPGAPTVTALAQANFFRVGAGTLSGD
jgi:hypothetical protein